MVFIATTARAAMHRHDVNPLHATAKLSYCAEKVCQIKTVKIIIKPLFNWREMGFRHIFASLSHVLANNVSLVQVQ